jgi:hypothetical protein
MLRIAFQVVRLCGRRYRITRAIDLMTLLPSAALLAQQLSMVDNRRSILLADSTSVAPCRQ